MKDMDGCLQVSNVQSDALFILLVEKDAAFMRLAEDRFYQTYPCIILTAKGQPDVASRYLLPLPLPHQLRNPLPYHTLPHSTFSPFSHSFVLPRKFPGKMWRGKRAYA